MPMPGIPELLLIFVIVVMLFGVGKLPEVFGSIGKGLREFRKESGMDDDKSTAHSAASSTPQVLPPQAPAPQAPVAQLPMNQGQPTVPVAPVAPAADPVPASAPANNERALG